MLVGMIKRTFLAAALLLAAAHVLAADPSVSSTRAGTFDYQCQEADGTPISNHTRPEIAAFACANLTFRDGRVRYVQGGRWRIAADAGDVTPPAPVNCVVSAWSGWTYTPWVVTGTTETRTATRTRTVTTQPANGGTACPALTETQPESRPYTPPATGTALLTWRMPTAKTDGTPITNPVACRLEYGRGDWSQQVANLTGTQLTLNALAAGTWQFRMTCSAGEGDSVPSNVATKVIS